MRTDQRSPTGGGVLRRPSILIRNALLFLLIACGTLGSSLKSDEVVVFLPTFASRTADGEGWNVNLHAWVFEPEERSFKRKALLSLLTRRLGLASDVERSAIFQKRARMFLVDNEGGKTITLGVGGKPLELGPTAANGHVTGTFTFEEKLISASIVRDAHERRFLRFDMEAPGTAPPRVGVTIPLIEPEGISVISDLDDTIKVSSVADKKALLMNTFCREFEAVPGMADLYGRWERAGAVFHYVSASPWQLHSAIGEFLDARGFPRGSMALKLFRWKDSSFFDLFAKSDEVKRPFIEEILAAFPRRKFLLVGDSGEADPELYASVARAHPEQIAGIFIRAASGEDPASSRFTKSFEGVSKERWRIFAQPSELMPIVDELARR